MIWLCRETRLRMKGGDGREAQGWMKRREAECEVVSVSDSVNLGEKGLLREEVCDRAA